MVDLRWGRLTMEFPARSQQGQGPAKMMSYYRPILTVAQRFLGKRSSINPILLGKSAGKTGHCLGIARLVQPRLCFCRTHSRSHLDQPVRRGAFPFQSESVQKAGFVSGLENAHPCPSLARRASSGSKHQPEHDPEHQSLPPATTRARARNLDRDVRAIAAWNAAAMAPRPVPPQA